MGMYFSENRVHNMLRIKLRVNSTVSHFMNDSNHSSLFTYSNWANNEKTCDFGLFTYALNDIFFLRLISHFV